MAVVKRDTPARVESPRRAGATENTCAARSAWRKGRHVRSAREDGATADRCGSAKGSADSLPADPPDATSKVRNPTAAPPGAHSSEEAATPPRAFRANARNIVQ